MIHQLAGWKVIDMYGVDCKPIWAAGSKRYIVGKIGKNTITTGEIAVINGRYIDDTDGNKYFLSSPDKDYDRGMPDIPLNELCETGNPIRITVSKNTQQIADIVDYQGVDYSLDEIDIDAIDNPELKSLFLQARDITNNIYRVLGLKRETYGN